MGKKRFSFIWALISILSFAGSLVYIVLGLIKVNTRFDFSFGAIEFIIAFVLILMGMGFLIVRYIAVGINEMNKNTDDIILAITGKTRTEDNKKKKK